MADVLFNGQNISLLFLGSYQPTILSDILLTLEILFTVGSFCTVSFLIYLLVKYMAFHVNLTMLFVSIALGIYPYIAARYVILQYERQYRLFDGSVVLLINILHDATLAENANPGTVEYMGLGSILGWAYGCSQSQAAFFNTTKEGVRIGVSLYNTEIQTTGVVARNKDATTGKTKVSFTLNVDDCTGTFSTGSWMAIISILVMLSGFIFGYLMLNSVQTMDRFDDPKQKQILINVRE